GRAGQKAGVVVVAANALGQGADRRDQLLQIARTGDGVALEARAVQSLGEGVERVDDAGLTLADAGLVVLGVVVVAPATARRAGDAAHPDGAGLEPAQPGERGAPVAPAAADLADAPEQVGDAGRAVVERGEVRAGAACAGAASANASTRLSQRNTAGRLPTAPKPRVSAQ